MTNDKINPDGVALEARRLVIMSYAAPSGRSWPVMYYCPACRCRGLGYNTDEQAQRGAASHRCGALKANEQFVHEESTT